MSYVARKEIVHGDLGCRNVLVFRIDQPVPKKNLVKITDFGLARSLKRLSNFHKPSIISIRYCALEILRNDDQSSYSEKCDVYSMGVLMWEALSNGEIPYSSISDDEEVKTKKLNKEKLERPRVFAMIIFGIS
jgi:serine/threonine protein kinase